MKNNQKGEFLSSRVRYIPINTVRPNPQQPRRVFDEGDLRELADSIRAYGILQPLTVRDRGSFYELVAGERRLRAARIAGLREVPCLVAAVGEEDAALLALIENLQRRDLDYMEEAAAIAPSGGTACPSSRRRKSWASPSPPWPTSCGCCGSAARWRTACGSTA